VLSEIAFDHEICGDPAEATSREWLETNGIGGFASSTIIGLNTRRYHGLLVAATKPPVGREVLLSKLEDTLMIDGAHCELSANQYRDAVYPQGYRYQEWFHEQPFPKLAYRTAGIEIEKSIFLVHGENTVVVQYRVSGDLKGRKCTLEVRPLLAFRDYHATTHANNALNRNVEQAYQAATVKPYGDLPSLHFAHNASSLDPSGFWYYNFIYNRERERGLDFEEDLFGPFTLHFDLEAISNPVIIASLDVRDVSEAALLETRERDRRNDLLAGVAQDDPFARLLTTAADQFIVSRAAQKSVIAGYPWFSDWGRDTMISLPGLTLVTGRFDEARSILREFAASVDRGMLPNRFVDSGQAPEYNAVDATLWMFHAVFEFLRYTRDYEFVRTELYKPLADILAWHERGTRYGIRMDSDGLLRAGEHGMQLTWMDARVGDREVTPREGKPVEIQALWYNALRVMERLAADYADHSRASHLTALADQAQSSFIQSFWNDQDGCLFDVVTNSGPDRSIRPNQIFAVSLPYPLLGQEQALRVIDVVEWELLTPYGLRTLSPRDPNYRGRFFGDPRARDGAYHQGTVWPWLLGPFLTAYVKVHGEDQEVRQRADRFLDALRGHLWQAGVGQISEVFDGDPPHNPGGCIAQAWSVAEVLRTYTEDVLGRKPSF
jgi:predicted glycogen debranching enzyme